MGDRQSTPTGHPAGPAISALTRPRADPAATGLGALRELELDHLHPLVRRGGGEQVGVEPALVVGQPKAGADLPDQVAAVPAVVR